MRHAMLAGAIWLAVTTSALHGQLRTIALSGENWPDAGATFHRPVFLNMNDRGLLAANVELNYGTPEAPILRQSIWQFTGSARRSLFGPDNAMIDRIDININGGDTEAWPDNYGDTLFGFLSTIGRQASLRHTSTGELRALELSVGINGSDPLWSGGLNSRQSDAAGNRVFGGTTRNPVTDARHDGIWLWQRDGAVRTLIHDGHTPLPAIDGRFLHAPDLLAFNDAGVTVFAAATDDPDDAGRKGLWRLDTHAAGASADLIFSPAAPVPGAETNRGFATVRGGAMNAAEQFAVLASLEPPATSGLEDYGMWVQRAPGQLELVARHGATLMAGNLPGTIRSFFEHNIQMNAAGDLLFHLELDTPLGRRGAWVLDTPDDAPVVVAADRMDFPSFSAATTFQAWLDERGQVILHSSEDTNRSSIWVRQPDGQLQPIVRTGDRIEVAPDDWRQVWSLPVFASEADGRGRIAFSAEFDDGTFGLFVSNAAVPEPATATTALIAALLLVGHYRWRKQ